MKALTVMATERRKLGEQLRPDALEGAAISGTFDPETYLSVWPRMTEVNSLIEIIKSDAKNYASESSAALDQMNDLFRQQLGLTYKLPRKAAPAKA